MDLYAYSVIANLGADPEQLYYGQAMVLNGTFYHLHKELKLKLKLTNEDLE